MTTIPSLIDTKLGKLAPIILIVDDSEMDRAMYSRYLNSDVTTKYQILEAETVKEALEIWQAHYINVVLVNCNLPNGDSWKLMEAMGKNYSEAKLPVIMLTEEGDESMAIHAIEKGAMDYLVKKDITKFSLCHSIGRVSDITTIKRERQEAIKALAASEAELRGLFNTIFDVILVLDKQGSCLKIIPTKTDKFSQLSEEIIGKIVHEILPPHLADMCVRMIGQTLATQETVECEYKLQIGSQIVWFSARVSPISPETVIWAALDITAAKRNAIIYQQVEQALEENQLLLQLIMDNLPIAVFWKDCNSRYLGCNKQLMLDAGLSSMEEIVDKTDFDLPWKREAPLYQADDRIVIESRQPKFNIEEPFTKTGNVARWLRTNKMPLKTTNGEIIGVLGCYEDITEQKQIEQERDCLLQNLEAQVTQRTAELRESEKRFRNLVETSSDWIWEVNKSGVYTYSSPQITKVLGYSSAEVLGKTPFDLMPVAEAKRVSKKFLKFVADQAPFQCLENINRHQDGRLIILEASAVPIFDADGQFRGYRGINRDITARKQTEIALWRHELRFQRIADNIPGVMYQYVLHPDGSYEFIYMSDRSQELYELEPATVIADANNLFKLVHPEDMSFMYETISHSARTLEQWSWEGRIITPSGRLKWVHGISEPQKQANGDILWDGLILDISDRKQTEERLHKLSEAMRLSEERLLLALEASGDGLWDWNIITGDLYFSPQWLGMLGFNQGDLPPHVNTWEQLIYPEDQPFVLEKLNAHLKDPAFSYQLDYRVKTKIGDYRWVANYGKAVVRDEQGNPLRMIGTHRDISERKQVESDLRQANHRLAISNQELARATRLKDEFLANMSHELRTPLNAILGISEGLQDGVFGIINQQQRSSLQTIERSGTHLLELINDILDLSKIEAGQMELNCAPIAISQLCQWSLSFIKQQAFQKRIQVNVKIQPNLPDILVDERRIRQVLINLLNNAVKFTLEGGTITLAVTQKEYPPESQITYLRDLITIAVIDTGIGITSENIPKLFQPFVQIDSSLNRKYTGTGLGLALVKRIVEMHGGQVAVNSQIGVGSSFFVDLPCANIPKSASQSVNQLQGDLVGIFNNTVKKSPLILLAEDNKDNILTFSSYLEAKGYRMILAENGMEAVQMTKSHYPDLILMDIQMPEMDGLEAIKQIRLNPYLATIPIIALTAFAMPGDQEKCLAAGANKYVSKPLKLRELVNTMQQLLEASN
jgi:PAS domain S-box-containing protein